MVNRRHKGDGRRFKYDTSNWTVISKGRVRVVMKCLLKVYLGGEAGGVQKACAAGKCCFLRAWIRLGRYSGSTHQREPFALACGGENKDAETSAAKITKPTISQELFLLSQPVKSHSISDQKLLLCILQFIFILTSFKEFQVINLTFFIIFSNFNNLKDCYSNHCISRVPSELKNSTCCQRKRSLRRSDYSHNSKQLILL